MGLNWVKIKTKPCNNRSLTASIITQKKLSALSMSHSLKSEVPSVQHSDDENVLYHLTPVSLKLFKPSSDTPCSPSQLQKKRLSLTDNWVNLSVHFFHTEYMSRGSCLKPSARVEMLACLLCADVRLCGHLQNWNKLLHAMQTSTVWEERPPAVPF